VSDIGRFRRKGFAFFPANAAGREAIASVKDGDDAFLSLWKPRNMRQHRKMFAILNNVVQATGEWPSVDALRFDIMRDLKRGTEYVSPVDGTVHFFPDSMKVASMPKADFERLYEDTMRWLLERYKCDPEFLTQEAA
jgi:hypothetical protein